MLKYVKSPPAQNDVFLKETHFFMQQMVQP